MDQSARRIYKAAVGTPEDHLVILLAHNGPTGLIMCHILKVKYIVVILIDQAPNFGAGLGSNIDDICGKDWVVGGGDYGDPG